MAVMEGRGGTDYLKQILEVQKLPLFRIASVDQRGRPGHSIKWTDAVGAQKTGAV